MNDTPQADIPDAVSRGTDPISVLREAIRQVPSVKYAFGVAGIAAAGALIAHYVGFGKASFIIIGGVFIAMVLLFIFSQLVGASNAAMALPGVILIYAVEIFFIIFLAFTVTAFAFRIPQPWVVFLGIESPNPVPGYPDEHAGPDSKDTHITSFHFALRTGGDGAQRDWTRTSPKTWSEQYPNGTIVLYNEQGRIFINGCPGTKVVAVSTPNHKVFIPDKGCQGMALYTNDFDMGWSPSSSITDIK